MVSALSIAAIALSLISCGIAAWCALRPPQTRLLREARAELHELAEDVERLHGLHHKRARRENMTAAQEAKARQGDLLSEAQAVLRGVPSPTAPATGSGAAAPAAGSGLSRDELRKRVLM